MSKQALRVLVVEDLPDDAELMILRLRQDGFDPQWTRVEEEAAFLRELDSPPDVILADYSLPHFSGKRVLELISERGDAIPVILVSGTVGEETAAESIKNGAFDYVLKGGLTRLAGSVRNALQEKRLREEALRAETALRASEIRFRKLFENAPDAYALLDASGRLLCASPSTQRLLGYEPAEIVGADPAQSTHPDDLPGLMARLAELIENPDRVLTVKYRFLDKNGAWRWLESTMANQLAEPSIGAIVFNFRDITDRVRVDEDLRKAEEKYRALVEQLPVITYLDLLDDKMAHGQFTSAYVSPQVEALLGYSPEDFYADADLWTGMIHPDHHERVMAAQIVHLRTKQPLSIEYPMLTRHGRLVWVRDEAVVVKGEAGARYSQGIVLDITERKLAEQALRESEARKAAILESSLDCIITMDDDGKILEFNPAALKTFGYSRESVIGKELAELIIPTSERDLHREGLKRWRLTGDGPYIRKRLELTALRADGTEFPVELTVTELTTGGRPIFTGFLRDITERSRAEVALRDSEERYRLLFHSNPWPMWVYAQDTLEFLAVNDVAVQKYGFSHAEFLSMTIRDIRPAEDMPKLESNVSQDRAAQELSRDWRHRTKDGQLIDVEISSHAIQFGGRPARLVLVNDVTERRKAEESLAYEQYLMRSLMDNIPDAVYFKDLESRFLRVNKGAAAKHGLTSAEEMVGKSDFDFFETQSARRMFNEERRIIGSGQPVIGAEEIESWPDRPPTWASTSRMPLRDENGAIVGTFGVSRDITERKRREMELEAITKVSAALRKAATRAEMVPIILDQLLELLRMEAAALAMLDPVSGEIVIELGRGVWSSATGRRLPAGEGISGQVITSGTIYLNNDIASDPRYLAVNAEGQLRAAACVPLQAQEQTIGALWISSNNSIGAAEMQLLTAISNIAASAIQRATLFEQTQRRLQQISALHSIDIAISSSFDLRFTLNILLEQVSSHLGVDATDVMLLNPNSQMLEYVAGRGFISVALDRLRFRLGEGLAGQAALERRIVSIPNLQEHEGRMARRELLAAERFVSYHGIPLIAKGQVKGVLEIFHRSPLNPDPEWLNFLETLAEQAAIAINDATMFDSLQRSNTELMLAYDATIEGWSRALDLRDNETEGHTQRVTAATIRLARTLSLSEHELIHIRRGSLLHDIGKMGIPDSILLKPAQLTSDEWLVMRKHPQYAYEMIRPIEFLRPAVDIPYCHHEKWDGSGYPRGLKGEHIPLAARIFSLADVWDALRSDRPYRKAWTAERALDYIRSERGKHFDPNMVDAFLSLDDLGS